MGGRSRLAHRRRFSGERGRSRRRVGRGRGGGQRFVDGRWRRRRFRRRGGRALLGLGRRSQLGGASGVGGRPFGSGRGRRGVGVGGRSGVGGRGVGGRDGVR